MQVHDISEEAASVSSSIEGPGHRGGIRAVAVSHDDTLLLSAAAEGCKLWSADRGTWLRSFPAPAHGLCAVFAPGDRHAVIGSKVGTETKYNKEQLL